MQVNTSMTSSSIVLNTVICAYMCVQVRHEVGILMSFSIDTLFQRLIEHSEINQQVTTHSYM
jgi:hypothetical protein